MNDFIFLSFLLWYGLLDLRHRRIKHWQIFLFASFLVLNLLGQPSLSLFILLNALAVLALGSAGYLAGRWGAADVKIITLSSLYNLYILNHWWVWLTLLLAVLIDICFWGFYFRHREEKSPLLLSWALAVQICYAYLH